MKLLYCNGCLDIIKLTRRSRSCSCHKSKGRYIDDVNIVYEGNCVPIGIGNSSFEKAMKQQELIDRLHPSTTEGTRFDAFIIPESSPAITRVD